MQRRRTGGGGVVVQLGEQHMHDDGQPAASQPRNERRRPISWSTILVVHTQRSNEQAAPHDDGGYFIHLSGRQPATSRLNLAPPDIPWRGQLFLTHTRAAIRLALGSPGCLLPTHAVVRPPTSHR